MTSYTAGEARQHISHHLLDEFDATIATHARKGETIESVTVIGGTPIAYAHRVSL